MTRTTLVLESTTLYCICVGFNKWIAGRAQKKNATAFPVVSHVFIFLPISSLSDSSDHWNLGKLVVCNFKGSLRLDMMGSLNAMLLNGDFDWLKHALEVSPDPHNPDKADSTYCRTVEQTQDVRNKRRLKVRKFKFQRSHTGKLPYIFHKTR